ncbi:hypothetical protein HK107_01490 [Parvularcula sp. ZS-1/3]|uniref:Endonuclease III n=1 Tax=Parvularcula mediterranea TaxID=2732508 RepID=A0A7Y3RK35_9PROT|nr:hypothetical protein [Parvularcula mediterranea]NNU14996.1 hypothetical protein [Parvularcula mediterranea]
MQAPLTFAVDNRLPDILERVTQLLPRLRPQTATNPLDQLLYGVIAQGLSSAGATACYRRVKERFPSFSALRDAEPGLIEGLMVGAPSAALKAQAIPEILRLIDEAFGSLSLEPLSRLDQELALRFLTRLPRVTEEIAASVLRFTGTDRLVLHIDKDVARPLRRLGLAEQGAPLSALPRQLIERSPVAWRSEDFAGLSRGLTRVADRFCHQGRPDCASCPLANLCPAAEKAEAKVVTFPFGKARKTAA